MSPAPDDESPPAGPDFGSGVLSQVAAFVYWHLIVGVLMCATSVPVVVLFLFLGRDPSNLPLVPLYLIPYGPVLSAGLYALRDRTRAEELAPARSFLRGIRIGWRDALKAWTPAMAFQALVLGGLTASGTAVSGWYVVVLATIAVIVLVWGLNALVIATFFSFRWRDIARLAVYYIGRCWMVAIGELALLVVAVGVVWLATEGALWLIAVVFAAFLLTISRPLVADVETRFTHREA
ncbi:glycosyltransferase [Microbacterium sp. NPDC096154]|uniref:glycosyltransferase n=1 Tax=Microbacterium sp. NPDC096154 TaxID=3155549 RepID=UPI003320143C